MNPATINRLIALFDRAFKEVAPKLDAAAAERLAMLVHHSMNPRTRVYHTPEHVFNMCDGLNGRQTLAALFHDIVYYQLDGGFPADTAEMLQPVVRDDFGVVKLRSIAPSDRWLALCAAIFGFKPGQEISVYGGLNEFLSAVVATRKLYEYVSVQDMMVVLACIEATVPFRSGQDAASPSDALAERLMPVVRQWLPDLDAQEQAQFVQTAVKESVMLANRDVAGFAEKDPGHFLATTWLLIEESNAPLKAVGIYSLGDYRAALMRMELFLSNLDPASIFHAYGDEPDAAELAQLAKAASINLRFACDFLDSKIATVAIVEALALCSGSDCPVSMFLGDIASPYGKPDRAEDHLPQAPLGEGINEALLRVFEKGRSRESNNDLTASPLTAYVYRCIGHQGMQSAIVHAKKMFDGTLSPADFLRTLDAAMLKPIIRACAQIAFSRRDALLALEQTL